VNHGRRRGGGLGRGGHRHTATGALDHELDGIALFRIQAAQLVLDVDTGLAAQVEQVLALHVQFARQGIDPYFLSLQAELLCGLARVVS
jgi:hypothetical protein